MRPRALLAFKRAATRVGLPQRSARLRLTMLYGALFLIAGAGLLAITYGLIAVTGESDVSNVQHGSPGAAGAPTGDDGPPVAPQILGLAEEHQSLGRLLLLSSLALMIMAVISMGLGWLMAGRVLRPLRTMTTRARQISELNLHERLAVAGPDDELKELGAGFLSSSRPVPPGGSRGGEPPADSRSGRLPPTEPPQLRPYRGEARVRLLVDARSGGVAADSDVPPPVLAIMVAVVLIAGQTLLVYRERRVAAVVWLLGRGAGSVTGDRDARGARSRGDRERR